jgi:CelD/BcsL family acetyltransferase involved in cellulose biosynthesis
MLMPTCTASKCRVECLTTDRELSELRDDWGRLATGMPLRGFPWASTWWKYYKTNRMSLWLLVVRDDDDAIIGIAPWHLTESPVAGRVIRFLASGEVCTDYLTILCDPNDREVVVDAIADHLLTTRSQWDVVELSAVSRDDAVIGGVANALAAAGHQIDIRHRWNGWRLELPDDWSAFLSRLSKSRRERTRKLLRDNVESERATLRRITSHQQLEQSFELLVRLHERRRASLGEPGAFRSQRFTAFHRQVCRELLACGQLRLLILELEGEPIAAEYSLTGDDTIYYYQGGFDPQFADQRPGWLSFAASLKLAVEEGYQYFDFMRGDEPYKASWKAGPVALSEIRIVGVGRSSRLRHAGWSVGQSMKHWVKRHVLQRGDGPLTRDTVQ